MSQQTEFRIGSDARRVERFVLGARAVLLWERAWRALWPATGVVGLFAAASLFDVFRWVPWEVHALLLGAAISATGLLFYLGFRSFASPEWEEGARRLERDSALSHRPISEAFDVLLAGTGDAWAEELWRANMRQRLAGFSRLRLSAPHPRLHKRDPRGWRFGVLVLVAAGLLFAGRDSLPRLWSGLFSSGANAGESLDAWIDPPAYTAEPPLYLRTGASALAVPMGSILSLRVHGADRAPGVSFAGSHATLAGRAGEYGQEFRIDRDSNVDVRASGRTLGAWTISPIPALPPHVEFAASPSRTEHAALKLSFRANDDYGVAVVRAIIRPHSRPGRPLVVDLPLSRSAKTVSETVYRDLTEHPYAGLATDIQLEAIDAVGHSGFSQSKLFTLPARIFTNPLARALIEQRQNLATGDPGERAKALQTLDALTIAPERFYQGQTGIYLTLRAAYWALRNAHHEDDVQHVEGLLWQIATAIEQGGLAVAAEELRHIQQMLSAALAQGAPQEVIDALLERYQQALQRYMQSLAQNPPQPGQTIPPGAKVLSEKDLDSLFKAIQQLAQSGNRLAATQMLALLQNLLENMHTVAPGGGTGVAGQDKALGDAVQGLGNLMGKQRGLLDKTFRNEQGTAREGTGLSNEQGQLRQELGKILQGLKSAKRGVPGELGDAERQMGQSQQELNNHDLPGSGEAQKQALDSLRHGAASLAQQMMAKQSGSESGESSSEDQDPLGRAQGNAASDLGGGVKLPSQSDLQRARSILEELRRRAGERGRPKEELDYIERLLKEF
ncbi:MAG: DUF4175 family protein [Alphaproteobacteria bacterium]|nr:DUF4175 family protein [Alphaproteobacteria bacterium]